MSKILKISLIVLGSLCLLLILLFFFLPIQNYEGQTLFQISTGKTLSQAIFPAKTQTNTPAVPASPHFGIVRRASGIDNQSNQPPAIAPAQTQKEKPSTAEQCREIAMSLLPKEVTYTISNFYLFTTLYSFDYSITAKNFQVLSERAFGRGGLRRAENQGENIHNFYGTDYLELRYDDLKITDSQGVILGDNIIEFIAVVDLGSEGVPIAETFSVPIKNAELRECSLAVPSKLT